MHTKPKPAARMPSLVLIDPPSLSLFAIEFVAAGDACLVVLRADVFHELDILSHAARGELQWHRLRVRAGIVKGEVVNERPEVGARESLDGVELLRVRCPAAVEPELVVVADRVDDQRVAFPTTDGVAIPAREQILWMLAAIHVDDAMRARVAELVQDVNLSDAFGRQAEDHLPRVRVDARNAHRQAGDVRLILLLAFVPERLRRRKEWQLARLQPTFAFDVGIRATAEPRSAQIGMSI